MSLFYYHSNLQIHRKSVVNICKNFVFARLKNAKGHSIAANTTFKKINKIPTPEENWLSSNSKTKYF